MNILDRVQVLTRMGFSIIPIPWGEKIPKKSWTEYQKRKPTVEEIKSWFNGSPSNIAIITGAISGVVVVDADSEEGCQWVVSNLPPTPLRVKTSAPIGRVQYYYRHPGGIIRNKARINTKEGKKCVDVRGDGGYVIAPGSKHPSGFIYKACDTFYDPLSLDALPIFNSKWIATPDAHCHSGGTNQQGLQLSDEDRIRRSRAYLAKVPGAVEGNGGDTHTFTTACHMVKGFGLAEDEAFSVLKEWNLEKCVPPWSDEELLAKIRNAEKYGNEPIGNKNSSKTTSINSDGPPLKLTSLNTLLSEPEEKIDWIVEGLLQQGGLSVIVAKPKTGKSTIARQLALCVSRGEEFFSRETFPGLVVYLAFEERRSDVRAHFKKMGAVGDEDIKVFAGMAPANAIERVREMAAKEKPILIIVDTLARLTRIKDLNDYSQTTLGIEPLLAIAREIGSHVCFLHHARKGDSKGIDSILGSTGIAGSVDTILVLHRTDKYRTVSSIQRVGQDIEEAVLDFDYERRWATLGGSREQVEIDRTKAALIDYLDGQAEAITERVIDDCVEGNRSHRKKALRQLVDEGKIHRMGSGKKGDPYLYKNSGILVPIISSEPEYQNPKNKITPQNDENYSGSQHSWFFDSGSQYLSSRNYSFEELVESAKQIFGAEVVA